MKKDKMLLKLVIDNFDENAYIQRVVYDRNSKYKTICTLTFHCSHIQVFYNNETYWANIITPDFKSKEELDKIPEDFDENQFTKKSYVKIYQDTKLYDTYKFEDIPQEMRTKIYNKIRNLIKNHNVQHKLTCTGFVTWK